MFPSKCYYLNSIAYSLTFRQIRALVHPIRLGRDIQPNVKHLPNHHIGQLITYISVGGRFAPRHDAVYFVLNDVYNI